MSNVSSLLPAESSRKAWGIFGYRGAVCDAAIAADNAPMLRECFERGFFDPDDEMLMFITVRQHCKKVAPNCYAMLQEVKPEAA